MYELANNTSYSEIEGQKCLQQVLLSPEEMVLHYEIFGELIRKEDVMYVDDDAGVQPGQDLEEQIIDISAALDDVGRIDKQNIISLELLE